MKHTWYNKVCICFDNFFLFLIVLSKQMMKRKAESAFGSKVQLGNKRCKLTQSSEDSNYPCLSPEKVSCNLPFELLLLIFGFLPPQDILKIQILCRGFRRVYDKNYSFYWRNALFSSPFLFCKSRFSCPLTIFDIDFSIDHTSYFQVFKTLYVQYHGKVTHEWFISKRIDSELFQGPILPDGNLHGTAQKRYIAGDIYRGQFYHGQMSGQGTMYYNDGEVYSGQWFNGTRHGRGIEIYPNNGGVHHGYWSYGEKREVPLCRL